MAKGLAHGDQQIIDLNPVTLRELGAQRHFSVLRSFGAHVTPAVRDTVDMGIDTDPEFLESLGDHQICGLAADSLQSKQLVDLVRHTTSVLLDQYAGNIKHGL